jgi:hypothetical protein
MFFTLDVLNVPRPPREASSGTLSTRRASR